MSGVPELGVLELLKPSSHSRRQTQAAWPGLGRSCAKSAAQSLSLPSPAHCPLQHHSTKTMKNVCGAEGAWRRSRGQWGPFSVPELSPLQQTKQQKRPLSPGVAPAARPSAATAQGTWERCCMELGIVPGQNGICCRSGICLFSNCLLPEQGSHPERL